MWCSQRCEKDDDGRMFESVNHNPGTICSSNYLLLCVCVHKKDKLMGNTLTNNLKALQPPTENFPAFLKRFDFGGHSTSFRGSRSGCFGADPSATSMFKCY